MHEKKTLKAEKMSGRKAFSDSFNLEHGGAHLEKWFPIE
jgi:hypothetical protein